jgi:phosphoribosylformylglycinamidine synthase
MTDKRGTEKGLNFVLPEAVKDKKVSVIEVGPFDEAGLAGEINKFLGTDIEQLTKTNLYLLVHPPELQGLESLLKGKPFVDPIIHRATLNTPLALELGLPFDYVLQSMLNPGTSDAEGTVALRQALLALGQQTSEGDIGFYSKQYFLKGDLTQQHLEEVSAFLANPDLNKRLIIPREEYGAGKSVGVPIVTLKPEIRVEKYDVVNMTDDELLKLNSERKLAASLEELHLFRDMYKDEAFLKKRKEVGLDEKATDVELETWFGLRSEHCFHKEFNAHITLEDKVDDPILKRAFEKGFLQKDSDGNYVLERGIFKTFVEEPAKKIFEKLEKRGKNWIVSMFEDNSGVVLYDENYMFCIKIETHNSPSNKEPVQGAKTGIDGVNRDIFGTLLGTFDAIANVFFYCTGNPYYKGWLPNGVKHPYTILKGITQGVREGGNEMQIPTLGGGAITDPRYIAKCLVYCGTVGWSPVQSPTGVSYKSKNPNIGDLVFVAGQPVGIDGVHGATESSLSASAEISLGHVQADFSFIQAKMKEYILSVSRENLLTSITDFGAMGLGSASHETAEATGGLDLDLALHPVKYQGIQPWQINASETQDRMLLVANPENKEELLRRAELHEIEVTDLGKLTDSGFVNLKYDGETVALIDIEKLFNKEPRKYMHATWDVKPEKEQVQIKGNYSLEESLCLVMSQPDVASKEWFFRQKDSSVKGGTIQSTLIGLKQEVEADATIQKPLDTEGKDFGAIAYALGIAPKLSDLDPYHSAQKSFIDMVGKIIAVGGRLPDMENPKWDAWAVCGNYCQPNSDSNTTLTKESGEHNLASLIREGIGVRDAIEATNIPVISGKDSMKCSCLYEVDDSFNLEEVPPDLRRHITLVEDEKTGKRSIEIHDPDTYLASCAVKIEDYRKCVNSAFKQEGDYLIYVVGTTKNHLGASQLLSAIGYEENCAPIEGGVVPKANLNEFVNNAEAVHAAIDEELVASCSYIHNGGLAVALAKAALAGEKGADIHVSDIHQDGSCTSDEELLYSETPGRFIVTIAPEDKDKFEETMRGVNCKNVGKVTNNNLYITRLDDEKEELDLTKVKQAYQKPLSFGLHDIK